MSVMERGRAGRSNEAEEKRKKIILAVGCVLLLGVLAIQGPRFLKQVKGADSATAAAPSSSSEAPVTGAGTPAATSATPFVLSAPAATPHMPKGLKAKDPFSPLFREEPLGSGSSSGASSSAPSSSSSPAPSRSSSNPVGFSVTNPSTPTVAPVSPVAAVIWIGDRPQIVSLRQQFPAGAPAFRLVSVSAKAITIRVAGGKFADGRSTVTIRKGHGITLVNTATGVRYDVRFATPTQAPSAQPTSPASN